MVTENKSNSLQKDGSNVFEPLV